MLLPVGVIFFAIFVLKAERTIMILETEVPQST